MVCDAMEDRGLPQDLEVGVQGRRVEAQNRRTACELDLCLLHHELAGVLDDDDQPLSTGSATEHRLDQGRNRIARSFGKRQGQSAPSAKDSCSYLIKIARLGGYLARAND